MACATWPAYCPGCHFLFNDTLLTEVMTMPTICEW